MGHQRKSVRFAAAEANPDDESRCETTASNRKRGASERDAASSVTDTEIESADNASQSKHHLANEKYDVQAAQFSFIPEASLVHEGDIGHAVTAFNLDDELNDGELYGESGFIPKSLRDRAADSPENSQSSSGSLDVARGKSASADGEDDPDQWVEDEEARVGTAPAYLSREENGSLRPLAKRARLAIDDMKAKPPSVEDVVAELSETLLGNETPVGCIRRLKRLGDLKSLEHVTELCDQLMSEGVLGVYEMDRPSLLERLRWSLSWGAEGGNGDIHGPFSSAEMFAWANAGFFSHPDKVGWVRATESKRPWLRAAETFL